MESINCKQTVVLYFIQKIKLLCIFAHILDFPPVLPSAKVIVVCPCSSSMFTKDQGLFTEQHAENVYIYNCTCIVCVCSAVQGENYNFLPSDDTYEGNFPLQMIILHPLVFVFQYFTGIRVFHILNLKIHLIQQIR